MNSVTSIVSCSLLAAAASAQNVLVVDQAGGGQFTSLATAIAMANPGDILDVRAGMYFSLPAIDKGIHLLGEPGVDVLGSITISNIPASQRFTMRDVRGAQPFSRHTVANCDGPVRIENLTGPANELQIRDSSIVHVERSTLRTTTLNSNVTFRSCQLRPLVIGIFGEPGLEVDRSTIFLAQCRVRATSNTSGPTAPGLRMTGSTVYVTGRSFSHAISAGSGAVTPAFAIAGSGNLVLDRRVPLVSSMGAPLVDPNIQESTADLLIAETTGAALGGTVGATLRGTDSEVWLLALGELAAPTNVPGVLAPLWLDRPQLAGVGVFDATATATMSLSVPNDPGLLGLHLGFQGVTQDSTAPGMPLRFSNPATMTVRIR